MPPLSPAIQRRLIRGAKSDRRPMRELWSVILAEAVSSEINENESLHATDRMEMVNLGYSVFLLCTVTILGAMAASYPTLITPRRPLPVD